MPKRGEWWRLSPHAAVGAVAWGLSACGLVVGFDPRDCVGECSSGASGELDSDTSSASPGSTGNGGSTTNGNEVGPSVGGATSAGPDGSGGSGVSTSSGNEGSGGGGTNGSGGNGPSVGGNGGAGSGGNGSGGAGGDGTGSDGTGGTGGDGTGGDGTGSGGTGGNATGGSGGMPNLPEAPCELGPGQTLSNSPAPVQLNSLSAPGQSRAWFPTWKDGSSIYLRLVSFGGDTLGSATELTSAADSAGLAAVEMGDDERAAVGWNVSASAVEMTLYNFLIQAPTFNPWTPSTGDLGGSDTIVTGMAARNDDIQLLAGLHDGEGVVAAFDGGSFVDSVSLQQGGDSDTVYSADAVWLAGAFRVLFIDDGGLEFTSVSSDASSVGAKQTIDQAVPDTGGRRTYVRVDAFDGNVAAVWLESGAVHAGLFDTAGNSVAKQVITPNSFNNYYPNLAISGDRLAVSWLDGNTSELHIQRLESGLQIVEASFLVATDVDVEVYGFGGDQLGSEEELYAAAFSTTSLDFVTITCDF